MKTKIQYEPGKDIDDVIEKWAKSSGLQENCFPIKLQPDDVAYCFCRDDGDMKTLITINTLDDQMYIEAWLIRDILKEDASHVQISRLLHMLGAE